LKSIEFPQKLAVVSLTLQIVKGKDPYPLLILTSST
jgi:hypothetical protein